MSGNTKGKFKLSKKFIAAILLPIILVIVIAPIIFYGTVSNIVDKVGEFFNDILEQIKIDDNKNLVIDEEYYDEIISKLESMGIDAESLGFGGDMSYLRTFLEAEIVTNFPYLGGEELQGTVYFERAMIDGTTRQLEYISYDEFNKMVNNSDSNAFNYFTVDLEDWTVHVCKNSAEGNFSIEKINYKTLVEKYTMPFEFVISLALVTQNPNFALALVDLVKDSKIVITIAESKTVTTTTTVVTGTRVSTITAINSGEEPNTTSEGFTSTNSDVQVSYSTSVMLTSARTWVVNEISMLTYKEDENENTQDPTELQDVNEGRRVENGLVIDTWAINRTQTITVNTVTQRWNKGKTQVIDKASNFTNLIKRTSISGGAIVEVAKECHDYLAENQYWYPSAANLAAGGYVADGAPVTHKFPEEGEPSNVRYVDCSAYASWVLKKAGYEDIACVTVSGIWNYGEPRGWERIEDINEVQAGDFCIWNGSEHINICVGKNENGQLIYYDCGWTGGIRAVDPITYNGSFYYAVRPNDEIVANASISTMSQLKESIEESLEGVSGTWGVSVVNLDNASQKFNINNSQIGSDGLIKLFIMEVAYDNIKNGKIKEEDIKTEIERMIQQDDSNSANNVITAIGKANSILSSEDDNEKNWEKGQEVIEKYLKGKYSNTKIVDKIKSYAENTDEQNYTSTQDVSKLMQSIYKGTCVNKEYSEKMKTIMGQQMFEDKISSGVISGEVYNKTSENTNAQQDSAIVSIDNANYVLTVMSYETTKEASVEIIKLISKKVYNYFAANGTKKNNLVIKDERLDVLIMGDKVCYKIPPGNQYQCPLDNLREGAEMLFEILASQEKTQDHVDLMKYFMYLLTGKSYDGVTEFDFNEFLRGSFSSVGTGYGTTIGLDYLQSWENSALWHYMRDDGVYSYTSTPYIYKCVTEDRKYFLCIADGLSTTTGNRNFGFGVMHRSNSFNYNNVELYEKYGVDIDSGAYDSLGCQLDVEIVENVKMDIFRAKRLSIEELIKENGIELEENQINALIAVSYQYGNLGNFVNAYKQYGNTEQFRRSFVVNGWQPFLTGYNGGTKRAQGNWDLFSKGIYRTSDGIILDPNSYSFIDGEATEMQTKIAEIAKNNQGNYPCTANYCAAWVTGVYQAAGAPNIPTGNAIDMWNKYKSTGSTSMDNIPIGAVVCGSGVGYMGSIYGHVGIYIGNGMVANNIGSHSIESLENWCSWQTAICQGHNGWIGWVYPGGVPTE